jgi:hypothetical protein
VHGPRFDNRRPRVERFCRSHEAVAVRAAAYCSLVRAPKPLFYALIVLVAGAAYPALAVPAPDRPPAVSLHSEFVFRLEVGAAVFLAAYALGAVLTLAYDGEFTRRLGLPGGTGIDTGRAQGGLEDAAGNFEQFQSTVEDRLDDHDTAIADLDSRLWALEDPPASGGG